MSLAGQPALIRAWDNLAAAQLIRARDKSETKNMWRLSIIKQ